MKEALERAVDYMADVTPEEFLERVSELTQECYKSFLSENNLEEKDLWYWSDSGFTPIYMFKGTEQELRQMNPTQGYLFTQETMGNGELRWNLSAISEIYGIPVTVVLMYISLESELDF